MGSPKSALKRAATLALAIRPAAGLIRRVAGRGHTEATVLCYHNVAENPSPGCVSRRAFEAQVDYLARHARVIPLPAVVRRITEGDKGGKDLVAITFDDGCRGAAVFAAPVLNALHFPYTFFIIRGRLEDNCYERDFIRRDELPAALGAMGALGAHGVTHDRPLPEQSPEGWSEELRGSHDLLVQFGVPEGRRYFCYPWARYTRELEAGCRSAGFDAAFAGSWRRYHSMAGLFRIGRVTVDHDDDLATFEAKLRGGRDLQGLLSSSRLDGK